MQSSILTGHAETTDVDELAILLSDWSQHYQQITPGAFSGSMKHVRFEGLQLFRETTSQRIHQAGTTAPSILTFAMPIALSEPVRWRGLMADADDMVCIWGGQEIDICNARHCDLLGVSVDLRNSAPTQNRPANMTCCASTALPCSSRPLRCARPCKASWSIHWTPSWRMLSH
jgi:hypothetical protein